MKFSDYADVTQEHANGFFILELKQEPFKGVKFSYGSVQFDEDKEQDEAHLKYDYDIHAMTELVEAKKSEFEKLTGDLLICMLEEQLEKNEVVYKGGVDSE